MRAFILGSVIGLLFLYTKNKNNTFDESKKQQKDLKLKCEKIVIDEFSSYLKKNENITLEEAILKFEKSDCKTLDEYSKIKGRSKEAYIDSYKEYFIIAKN